MELPPTPQNPSTITSPLQRSAKCSAIFSGVTEYQDSSDSILIPSSYLEKRRYRWCQYFLDSAYGKSAVVWMASVVTSLSCVTDEVSDIDLKIKQKTLFDNFKIPKNLSFWPKRVNGEQNHMHEYYGNVGCQVSKERVQDEKYFLTKIDIVRKGKYNIL